jgi:nitrogen fixation NifU-like protein
MDLSPEFLDHLVNPRNRGQLPAPDGVGELAGPRCGDAMTMSIRVSEGRIADAKFKTSGCWAAQAAASMVTEAVKGMAIEDAARLPLAGAGPGLTSLPEDKRACAELALAALRAAIRDEGTRRAKAP